MSGRANVQFSNFNVMYYFYFKNTSKFSLHYLGLQLWWACSVTRLDTGSYVATIRIQHTWAGWSFQNHQRHGLWPSRKNYYYDCLWEYPPNSDLSSDASIIHEAGENPPPCNGEFSGNEFSQVSMHEMEFCATVDKLYNFLFYIGAYYYGMTAHSYFIESS